MHLADQQHLSAEAGREPFDDSYVKHKLCSEGDKPRREWGKNKYNNRTVQRSVLFKNKFKEKPIVHIAFSLIDADCQKHTRIETFATSISETGFELIVETWEDSKVYKVRIDWLAIGVR